MKTLIALAVLVTPAALWSQTLSLSPVSSAGWFRRAGSAIPLNGPSGGMMTGMTANQDPNSGNIIQEVYAWAASFDLSALPSGTAVTSASLELRQLPFATLVSHRVLAYADNGTINAADFPNSSGPLGFGSPAGARTLGSFIPTATGDLFDVSNFIATEQLAGSNFVALRLSAGAGGGPWVWASPTLRITYAPVPEPATLVAIGVGTVGLLRRRRSAARSSR